MTRRRLARPIHWEPSKQCLGHSLKVPGKDDRCRKRTKHWSGYCGQHRSQYKQESEAQ